MSILVFFHLFFLVLLCCEVKLHHFETEIKPYVYGQLYTCLLFRCWSCARPSSSWDIRLKNTCQGCFTLDGNALGKSFCVSLISSFYKGIIYSFLFYVIRDSVEDHIIEGNNDMIQMDCMIQSMTFRSFLFQL